MSNSRRTFFGWLASVFAVPFLPRTVKAEAKSHPRPLRAEYRLIPESARNGRGPYEIIIMDGDKIHDGIIVDGLNEWEVALLTRSANCCFSMAHYRYTGKIVSGKPAPSLPRKPMYSIEDEQALHAEIEHLRNILIEDTRRKQ